MFGQTFEPRDLLLVLALVLLEGLLSIDNALVLGLLARGLPEVDRSKALSYGLIGSFLFRLIAIAAAAWLLKWHFVKLIGGGYLLYIAVKHLLFHGSGKAETQNVLPGANEQSISAERWAFWSVVGSIELTDITFAVDSILAGIALVGPMPSEDLHTIHPKLWVILLGGMLGVVLMRFAAFGFIRLLKRFPRFETSAYLLVGVVAVKLIADWWFNGVRERVNFQSPADAAFWIFWSLMALSIGFGFLPERAATHSEV